jgi:predicted dehydrogenase
LDAVDVCVPPNLHVGIVEAAAGHGVNILCEKPIGRDVAEAEAIDGACRRAGVIYMPGHNTLFYPTIRRARGFLRNGDIGPVHLVQSWDCSTDVAGSRLSAEVPPQAPAQPGLDWRSQPDVAGGGALIDGGFHPVYRLLYLVDEPAVEVTAMAARFREDLGWHAEDSAIVTVRFASGTLGQVTISYAFDPPHTGVDRLFGVAARDGTLAGDEAVLHYRPAGWDAPARLQLSELDGKAAWRQTFVDQASHFLNVLRGQEQPHQTTGDAIAALRVIRAAYESMETGRHVQLAPEGRRP